MRRLSLSVPSPSHPYSLPRSLNVSQAEAASPQQSKEEVARHAEAKAEAKPPPEEKVLRARGLSPGPTRFASPLLPSELLICSTPAAHRYLRRRLAGRGGVAPAAGGGGAGRGGGGGQVGGRRWFAFPSPSPSPRHHDAHCGERDDERRRAQAAPRDPHAHPGATPRSPLRPVVPHLRRAPPRLVRHRQGLHHRAQGARALHSPPSCSPHSVPIQPILPAAALSDHSSICHHATTICRAAAAPPSRRRRGALLAAFRRLPTSLPPVRRAGSAACVSASQRA